MQHCYIGINVPSPVSYFNVSRLYKKVQDLESERCAQQREQESTLAEMARSRDELQQLRRHTEQVEGRAQ